MEEIKKIPTAKIKPEFNYDKQSYLTLKVNIKYETEKFICTKNKS